MKRIFIATTALLGVMVGQNAWAATTTDTMGVTANVGNACTISAIAPLKFRTLTTTSGTTADSTTTATFSLSCSNGDVYDIGLLSAHDNSGQPQLFGTASSGLVNYNLYSDSGYSTAWTNTIGSGTVTGTGTGSAVPQTVYAKVPAGQTGVTSDAYTDTITITVTY